MGAVQLYGLGARRLARLVAEGEITATETVDAAIAPAEAVDPGVGSLT
jgi:Asp-tRNA(Asn)/Glu-tRNA(Gln) amidotransferase A subunit family amidase